MENKKVTCGGILINNNQVLIGRPTGYNKWSFPKGIAQEGQNHLQAAIRQIQQQTGIKLTNEISVDVGIRYYNQQKDIHLFIYQLLNKPSNLHCDSMFTDKAGFKKPQIQQFKWVSFDVALNLLNYSSKIVFQDILEEAYI